MATALIIDDDADIRSLLSMALELDGHDVHVGVSGREGLERLAALVDAGDVPVVVLDVQMPDIDGWEVLERVRSESRYDAVPVVLCTVKAMQDDLDRGTRLGCDAHESKPFDIASVSRLLGELGELDAAALAARRERARTSL